MKTRDSRREGTPHDPAIAMWVDSLLPQHRDGIVTATSTPMPRASTNHRHVLCCRSALWLLWCLHRDRLRRDGAVRVRLQRGEEPLVIRRVVQELPARRDQPIDVFAGQTEAGR